ncbi:nucleotidyltransferase domain-containing protein [Thermococcus chitonophagus]
MIRKGRERYIMIKNYRKYLPAIERACREIFGECEMYIFGSVLMGKFTAGSDVDVLIKVKELPDETDIREKIEELAELPDDHPFEFHVVDEEGFKYYRDVLKARLVKINSSKTSQSP